MMDDASPNLPYGQNIVPQSDGQALQPWLPDITHDDQSRVDDFITRASATATLRAYRALPAAPAVVAAS